MSARNRVRAFENLAEGYIERKLQGRKVRLTRA